MGRELRIALLGRGDISARYAMTLWEASGVDVVAWASRSPLVETAPAGATWTVMSVEALFWRTDIDLVINLTPPLVHAETTARALEAGFHVYSEKPLAATLDAAERLIEQAGERGLTLACAPATFLGPAQQTARRMIDEGELGEIIGATATMIYPGPDLWHHNPDTLFGSAAGPIFDMGVYDVTALVHLLGPVRRVTAAGSQARAQRTIMAGARQGQSFGVDVPTHAAVLIEFESGPTATLTVSFDGIGSLAPGLEIYGSRATLVLPRSGAFSGTIRMSRTFQTWEDVDPIVGWTDDLWPIGVLEAAQAIQERRPPRTSNQLALHVLEVLTAITRSIETGERVSIHSRPSRPQPLPRDAYASLASSPQWGPPQ